MNNDAMKELSILLAEIEAIKIEVRAMESSDTTNVVCSIPSLYTEEAYLAKASQIRAIADKMRRIDTRPGVS